MVLGPNTSLFLQGVEWEYLKKPSSPTNSLIFSDYEYTPSSKSSSVSSYPPSPSSSPTFGRNTSPHKSNKSVTSESSCSGSGTCHSPLLEDCRNHIGSFEDLSEIKGHILEFSRDQVLASNTTLCIHNMYNHMYTITCYNPLKATFIHTYIHT